MNEREVVFWDFDGTLAERAGQWPDVLREALEEIGSVGAVSRSRLADGLRDGFPQWSPGVLRRHETASDW